MVKLNDLELLPVEESLLNLNKRLLALSFHERLGASAIPTPIARHNQIGDSARLEKCGIHHPWIVCLDEFLHFHEADANDGRLAIIPEPHTVAEASTKSNHVLERSAYLVSGSKLKCLAKDTASVKLHVDPHPIMHFQRKVSGVWFHSPLPQERR